MPIPELQAPSVNPEAAPASAEAVPSQGAFSGAHIGAGLSEDGKALFSVGHEAHMKAATALAQSKEIEFLEQGEKVRDDYKLLHNMDAVQKHEEINQKLTKLYNEVGSGIGSKHAQELYRSNALRRLGIIKESVDNHFEKESDNFQAVTYKTLQEKSARTVSGLAGEAVYPAAAIKDEVMAIKGRALERYKSLGPEIAEEKAKQETHVATDALFGRMLSKGSNRSVDLIQSELKAYNDLGMVDAATHKHAQGAIGGLAVNQWVAAQMANLRALRVDHDGMPNPEGFIPFKALRDTQAGVDPKDPQYEQKIDTLTKEWERENTAFKQASAEMAGDVVKQGVIGDKSSLLWQRFAALHPIEAATMDRKLLSQRRVDVRWTDRTKHLSNMEAYGSVRNALVSMPSSQIRDVTDATVEQMMRDGYRGPGVQPDEGEMAKAKDLLHKLQKPGALNPLERRFGSIAFQALSDAYHGNRAQAQSQMNKAHYMLEDAFKENPKITENELRQLISTEFSKKGHGWFGTSIAATRPGEKYVARPANAIKGKDGNWYVPNKDGYTRWEAK